jgi:hypothetical protein
MVGMSYDVCQMCGGDDGEKSFNQRLTEELNKIDNDPWKT